MLYILIYTLKVIERNIKQFPVYINRNDIKKYFVDIDIFENKEG